MTQAPANGNTASMRCFLALIPDAASRIALQRLRDTAADQPGNMRGVRWVDAASLHLTLRFFGAATVAQVEYLKHMLPMLARNLPAVDNRRCAIWPNRAQPRLLVLEMHTADGLLALAQECESLAQKAGIETETRAFKAHLTLARLRPGCLPDAPATPAAPIRFDSLALIASDLQAAGARYRSLASIALPVSAS